MTPKVSDAERKATDDPSREMLLAALRCARLRALLVANELAAVGIAVSRDLVPVEIAYEWIDDINAWPFLAPEVGKATA
jgi:hypothetical protein